MLYMFLAVPCEFARNWNGNYCEQLTAFVCRCLRKSVAYCCLIQSMFPIDRCTAPQSEQHCRNTLRTAAIGNGCCSKLNDDDTPNDKQTDWKLLNVIRRFISDSNIAGNMKHEDAPLVAMEFSLFRKYWHFMLRNQFVSPSHQRRRLLCGRRTMRLRMH